MKNPPDALKQYVALRDSIMAEREQLISRVREMDAALGATGLRGKDTHPKQTSLISQPCDHHFQKSTVTFPVSGSTTDYVVCSKC
jgi:hypothetical protein